MVDVEVLPPRGLREIAPTETVSCLCRIDRFSQSTLVIFIGGSCTTLLTPTSDPRPHVRRPTEPTLDTGDRRPPGGPGPVLGGETSLRDEGFKVLSLPAPSTHRLDLTGQTRAHPSEAKGEIPLLWSTTKGGRVRHGRRQDS